jgi:hypothetical protein
MHVTGLLCISTDFFFRGKTEIFANLLEEWRLLLVAVHFLLVLDDARLVA